MSYLERLRKGEFSQIRPPNVLPKLTKAPSVSNVSDQSGHISKKIEVIGSGMKDNKRAREFYNHIFGPAAKTGCCFARTGRYCPTGQVLWDAYTESAND